MTAVKLGFLTLKYGFTFRNGNKSKSLQKRNSIQVYGSRHHSFSSTALFGRVRSLDPFITQNIVKWRISHRDQKPVRLADSARDCARGPRTPGSVLARDRCALRRFVVGAVATTVVNYIAAQVQALPQSNLSPLTARRRALRPGSPAAPVIVILYSWDTSRN